MIIPVFNATNFRENVFYQVHGLNLINYTDEQLEDIYNYWISAIGQNVLNIINGKFYTSESVKQKALLSTAENILAHVLYCQQYNLVAGSLSSMSKGNESMSFHAVDADMAFWKKTSNGLLIASILENNYSIHGETCTNLFEMIGG